MVPDPASQPVDEPLFVDELEQMPPASANLSAYEAALSRVAAAEMANNYDVKAFRARWLPDGLLRWEDVEEWLWHLARDHQPALFLEIQLTVPAHWDGSTPLELPTLSGEQVQRGRQRRMRYLLPPAQRTRWDRTVGRQRGNECPVTDAPALIALARLSEDIARRVPWSDAQTTVFLLTGMSPLIRQVQFRRSTLNLNWPALDRLELSISAHATDHELAAFFQAERASAVARARRQRALSEQDLALAIFGTLPQGRDGTPAERMAAWNAAHPQWAYRETGDFLYELERAHWRLLGVTLPGRRRRRARQATPSAETPKAGQ